MSELSIETFIWLAIWLASIGLVVVAVILWIVCEVHNLYVWYKTNK
jgi:hypothetical protein